MEKYNFSAFRAMASLPDLKGPFWASITISLVYLIGNVVLFESMVELVKSAANPFFAIFIVVVTVLGQALALMLILKLFKEAFFVYQIKAAVDSQEFEEQKDRASYLLKNLDPQTKGIFSFDLFNTLFTHSANGKNLDRASLSNQLKIFEDVIQRRSAIAQHIANSLIGLGLFGTFLGLIVTLKEVAVLIGGFAVEGDVDSASLMGQFFQNMSGPLAGMGEAFVASLLGLGGSMVNGLQMIYVKKLQNNFLNIAETEFFESAEKIGAIFSTPTNIDPDDVNQSISKLQLNEIAALRMDVKKQTDAILLSASRMRLASSAMVKTLEVLDRMAGQEGVKPNINRLTALVEQKMNLMVDKLGDSQNVQQQLLTLLGGSDATLKEINQKSLLLINHAANNFTKISTLQQGIIDADMRAQTLSDDRMSSLKELIHSSLSSLSVVLSEGVRYANEQTRSLGDITSHAKQTNLQLVDIEEGVKKVFESVRPQVIEMIARLEKSEQNMDAISKYDWANLHNKFEDLQNSIEKFNKPAKG